MSKVLGIGIILSMMLFMGCASKESNLDDLKKELLTEKPIAIFSVPVTGIYIPDKWIDRTVFKEFPFASSLLPFDYQGKFHDNFYRELKSSWNAISLDKVDWDAFYENPEMYDIVTIGSIGIADSGNIADDFMTNIAKAYNIAPSKMENLKKWIENGGILWSEAGIRASRFETFYPYGGINDAKTLSLFSKDRGTIFGLSVRHRVLKSSSVDMVNYEPVSITLKAPSHVSQLQGVSKVNFQSTSFIESYPIIQSNPLLIDDKGISYASYGVLGKGIIITMVPTVYWQADEDGELYRWKLLSWVLQRQGNENAKFLENPIPKR